MSELNLPLGAKIDLPALCRNDSNYRLTLPQSLFTRLADSCAGLRSDATLEVHFYRDLQGLNTLEGTIARAKAGNGGFGYDPVFIPDEFPDRTLAEITEEQKNAISHRGKALRAMAEYLNSLK